MDSGFGSGMDTGVCVGTLVSVGFLVEKICRLKLEFKELEEQLEKRQPDENPEN